MTVAFQPEPLFQLCHHIGNFN